MRNMSTVPSREELSQTLGLDRTRRRWRFAWRWGVAGLVALAAVVVGWYVLYGAGQRAAPHYVTAAVERGDLRVRVTATGTLEPLNEVEISSELSGIIRKVLVDYNDKVRKGQVLAELDTDKLEAQVAHSRATLAAARAKVEEAGATLAEARQNFERYRQLVERKVASEQKFDEAKAARDRAASSLDSAKADVAVAEADLKLRQTDLDKACICSPIDGVVLRRRVEPGQTVASTLQAPVLFTVAEDLAAMRLLVDVDEADVSLVAEGQSARFTVDAYPERNFAALVTMVRYAPETTEGVVTYKAHLSVDNRDLLLRPGMTATAEISVKTVTGALLIPNEALRFVPPEPETEEEGRGLLGSILPRPPSRGATRRPELVGNGRRVWVLKGGELVAVSLVIGLSDGQRTEVVSGELEAGQRIVVEAQEAGS
jgi:HlyD family secretion protein